MQNPGPAVCSSMGKRLPQPGYTRVCTHMGSTTCCLILHLSRPWCPPCGSLTMPNQCLRRPSHFQSCCSECRCGAVGTLRRECPPQETNDPTSSRGNRPATTLLSSTMLVPSTAAHFPLSAACVCLGGRPDTRVVAVSSHACTQYSCSLSMECCLCLSGWWT